MEGSALRFLTFLFLPRGRIGRTEFWIGLFVHIWILRRLAVPQAIMALADGVLPAQVGWLGGFLAVVDFWLVWCHFAKRWHDMNFAAVWTLVLFIPALGPTIGFLMLGFLPGSRAANRHGAPRPLRAALDELVGGLNGAVGLAAARPPVVEPVPIPVSVEEPPRVRTRVAAKGPPPVVVRRDGSRLWGPRSPDRASTSAAVRRRR